MTRMLSVWLVNFPIERLRRLSTAKRPAPSSRSRSAPRPEHAFALAEPTANGVIITAVNQSARRAGIFPGQSVADARAICPHLSTRPAELKADAEALKRLGTWFGRYGPHRGIEGEDGLWVDTDGVAHLFAGEQALADDAVQRLARAGYTARAAIADTPGAAYALARYATSPDQPSVVAPQAETRTAIDPLPVDALRLEPKTVLLLKRLGLKRIGDVSTLPRDALARRFRDAPRKTKSERDTAATAVVWRLDQALGSIREPKAPIEVPAIYRARCPFSEPLISAEGVEQAVVKVCEDLSRDLEDAGVGALSLRLSLFRADGTLGEVRVGASRPTAETAHMLTLFREPLAAIDAGLGIDVLVLDALRVAPIETGQVSFSSGQSDRASDPAAAARLVDRLSNRLGANAVTRLQSSNAHLPHRAEHRAPALAARDPSAKAKAAADSPPDRAPDCALRPAFVFADPEPVTVIAELPEGPPARFHWRRKACRIRRAIGPERIAPEWWQALAALKAENAAGCDAPKSVGSEPEAPSPSPTDTPHSAPDRSLPDPTAQSATDDTGLPGTVIRRSKVPRARDYYVLEAEDGGRYWAFREGLYQKEAEDGATVWYIQGVFG